MPLVTIGSAVLGGLAGAFLPRIAYRMSVPFGAPAPSACAVCEAPFPSGLQGWVHIGSDCPSCGTRIASSAWVSAAVSAIVCGSLARSLWPSLVIPVFLLAGVAGVVLSLIDIACMRLPDVIVLPLLGTSVVSLGIVSIATDSPAALVRAATAAVALAGFYLVLGFVVPAGVGLGDVKLALVLGLLLGWFGWGFVFVGAIIAHLIHGVTAMAMMVAGRADRKTLLPMGPALLAGAWFAIAVVPVVFTVFGA